MNFGYIRWIFAARQLFGIPFRTLPTDRRGIYLFQYQLFMTRAPKKMQSTQMRQIATEQCWRMSWNASSIASSHSVAHKFSMENREKRHTAISSIYVCFLHFAYWKCWNRLFAACLLVCVWEFDPNDFHLFCAEVNRTGAHELEKKGSSKQTKANETNSDLMKQCKSLGIITAFLRTCIYRLPLSFIA